MSIYSAAVGQTAKLALTTQYVDGTGVATDPTGTPQIQVFYADPAGSLTLKATLNQSKQASLTGFYGAFLDISNGTTYPVGKYVLRGTATVSGVATAYEDFLEVFASGSIAATGILTGAYCSEQEVRDWADPLADTNSWSSGMIAEKAAQGSAYIDAYLRGKYLVPFTNPPPEMVELINIWLAVAYCLEKSQASRANKNDLSTLLIERADEKLADILSGVIVLEVAPLTTLPLGAASPAESTTIDSPRVHDWDLENPGDTVLGRW